MDEDKDGFRVLLLEFFCFREGISFQLRVSGENAAEKQQNNLLHFLWNFLWALYYWWCIGTYCNVILKQDDFIAFFRGMIRLDKYFTGILQEKNLVVHFSGKT